MNKHIASIVIGLFSLILSVVISVAVIQQSGHHAGATVENFPTWYAGGVTVGSAGPNANRTDQIVWGTFTATSTTFSSYVTSTFNVTSSAFMKLSVGDPCIISDSAATSSASAPFGAYMQITSISSTIPNATATVTLTTGTSSLLLATGTLEYVCFDNASF